MKTLRIVILSTLICTCFTSLYTQTDCRPYVPQEEGSTWIIDHFSGKDKKISSSVFNLKEVVTEGDVITYRINTKSLDKKGKEDFESEYEATCKNGVFFINMEFMLSNMNLEAYKDMDMTMDASDLEFPDFANPSPGPLNDADMNMQISGPLPMNIDVLLYDRECLGTETITTPAGTFDCIKVSQNSKINMVITMETSSIEWYAENIGLVRSESYNRRGKLTSYSELKSITN